MRKEKQQPEPEKEIGKAEFLNLLDLREEQIRDGILKLQLSLFDVQDTRRKVHVAEERDMRSRFFTTSTTIRIESTVKPKMGFNK